MWPSSTCSATSSRSAFPIITFSPKKSGAAPRCRPGPCWVFDPIDGTTNYAHGIPIFCASLALEIDGVAQVAAVFDPTRSELFTAERGGGAFLNGAAHRGVRRADRWSTRCSSPAFRTTCTRASTRSSASLARFVGRARAVRRLGFGGDRSLLRRGRAHGRLLGIRPQALGHRRRRAHRRGGGRTRDATWTARRSSRATVTSSPQTLFCTRRCSRLSPRSAAAGCPERATPHRESDGSSGRFPIREILASLLLQGTTRKEPLCVDTCCP